MLGLALVVALAMAPSAARAAVSRADAAATAAYVHARYALAKATAGRVAAELESLHALDRRVAGECPNVLAAEPSNAPRKAQMAVINEILAAAILAELEPDRGDLMAIARTVGRLRWSDRRLTRLLQAEARHAREIAAIPTVPLCADLRAWAASGFQVVPPATERLDRELPLESGEGSEEVTVRLLRPFEGPADRRIMRRVAALESKRSKAIERGAPAALATLIRTLRGKE